jgi:HEAT repeat protein
VIVIISVHGTATGAIAQNSSPPDIRALMGQLIDPHDTRADTLKQIVLVSEKDPTARQFVVEKLPDLIRGPESDLWLDANRLAGKLKAKEAVPALQEAMSRPPVLAETFITFAGLERLDNDLVAKTLSQIGDPAIPAVTALLKTKDFRKRYRAILILRNIGSPLARKALEHQRSLESNQENVKLIDESLRH